MRPIPSLALALAILAAPLAVADPASASFVDPIHRFSVEVPALGAPDVAPAVGRLVVAGPMIDGFATNCNVQVQYPGMGHAEFIALSLQQFSAAGFPVVANEAVEVSGLPAARMEYRGSVGGQALRFLALVVTDAERVVMLTCTAPEERFEAERGELGRVLASFEILPGDRSKSAVPTR
jgi:hypothetical protein